MLKDSLSSKPSERAAELLMKFAQRETVAKAPVVATQHEVVPPPVVQSFEPRPLTIGLGMESKGLDFRGTETPLKEVLVLVLNDTISGLPNTTETSQAVDWPDGTACTVDIGNQDVDIGWLGYRVDGGNLYLRWISFAGSGGQLNNVNVTITAFL